MQLYDYKEMEQYLRLGSQDKMLFDFFFPTLIRQGYIIDTNEEMLNSFKGTFSFKSERALRDHINILIENGLIERDIVHKIQQGNHINVRYLYLNKYNFPDLTCYARPSNHFKAKTLEDMRK